MFFKSLLQLFSVCDFLHYFSAIENADATSTVSSTRYTVKSKGKAPSIVLQGD